MDHQWPGMADGRRKADTKADTDTQTETEKGTNTGAKAADPGISEASEAGMGSGGIWNRGLRFSRKLSRENMIVIALVGVLLMIIALPVNNSKNDSETGLTDSQKRNMETDAAADERSAQTAAEAQGQSGSGLSVSGEDYAAIMEGRLEKLLSDMEGVGAVRVMVTLSSSEEQVVEKDIPQGSDSTKETDSSGGTRQVSSRQSTESTIFTTDSSGKQIPYVKKTLEPKVEGITVVAQGGGNALVQAQVSEVIQALFDVEAHKIKVVRMKTS